MRSLLPALLLLLAGCAEDSLSRATALGGGDGPEYEAPTAQNDDDDAGTGNDDDDNDAEDPAPPLEIATVDPEPESTDHHYRQPIRVWFSGYAGGVQVRVTNEAGDSIPVITSWDEGLQLLEIQPFEGNGPSGTLNPLSTYTVDVDVGDITLGWSFTTSVIGTPVDDTDSLAGRTYAMQFADVRVPDSAGLEALLASLGDGPVWLWQVELGDGREVDFYNGVGEDGDADGVVEQDPCTTTWALGGADARVELLSNPYFASSPGDFGLSIDGTWLSFEEGWVEGDFAPGGDSLVEVALRGWLRAESLVPLVGDDACAVLEDSAKLTCVTCPSGEGDCAWVEVEGFSGVETSADFSEVDDEAADDCGDEPLQVANCSVGGRPAGLALLLLPLLVRRRR